MKTYIILFLSFIFLWCTDISKQQLKNDTTYVEKEQAEEQLEEKEKQEIVNNEDYTGANIDEWFKKIRILYDEGNYIEVNDIVDNLDKNNKWIESIDKFLSETEIWKLYTNGELLEKNPRIVVENWDLKSHFTKITSLYDEKKYDEVKKLIDKLSIDLRESEWFKDFLENTDIWKLYVNWEL